MSNARQQQFIQTLIETGEKLSLEDFFKKIHKKFYPNYDISFMKYFLELTENEGELCVHHEKLIEYGIMSSKQSSNVKVKLDAVGLVEEEDYRLIDIYEPVPQGGYSTKKVYMLTPEAFKTCLLRARRYPNQKVDPQVYSKYYLLLEKTYKLYTDYEKQLLSKQLEQKDQTIIQKEQQLEQKDQIIVQKDQELEEQKIYTLRLNEMLIDSSNLLKTQVVYIATSTSYANQNRFKVGGVESLDKLASRLSTYNTGSANGDLFYYAEWFLVHNYKEIEDRLKDLLGRFRDQKPKEIYIMHYHNLFNILEYLVEHYNDEVDLVNSHIVKYIDSLDRKNTIPFVPKEKCLKSVKIKTVGQPTVKIEASSDLELMQKLEDHFKNIDKQVTSVTFKSIFDALNIKKDRLQLYAKLLEIGNKIRPDILVKKK